MSLRIFKILRDLGHEIVACDEEGLLTYHPELYYERRVSPEGFRMITHLFAWGPANARLFADCPYETNASIHVTGNPRFDLMRSELRGYLQPEVEALRERFGDLILINTNFSSVNHRVPALSWLGFLDMEGDESLSEEGEFKIAKTRHRLDLFSHFRKVLPILSSSFPDLQIVLRPHPLEDHAPWRDASHGCPNVHVVHEGNVLPWLLAAKAVVQNNCTTAIEGYLLDRPVLSYMPVQSTRFDSQITNAMGHPALSPEDLCSLISQVLEGRLGVQRSPEPRRILEQHIAVQDGPLASDRIVDVLEASEERGGRPPETNWLRVGLAWLHVNVRRLEKNVRARIPGDKNSRAYQIQRFPGLPIESLRVRIERFGSELGRFEKLRIDEIARNVYRIEQS